MLVRDLKAQLVGVPDDGVVQIHMECKTEPDGTVVRHGAPARRIEIDSEVPGVGVVVEISADEQGDR